MSRLSARQPQRGEIRQPRAPALGTGVDEVEKPQRGGIPEFGIRHTTSANLAPLGLREIILIAYPGLTRPGLSNLAPLGLKRDCVVNTNDGTKPASVATPSFLENSPFIERVNSRPSLACASGWCLLTAMRQRFSHSSASRWQSAMRERTASTSSGSRPR